MFIIANNNVHAVAIRCAIYRRIPDQTRPELSVASFGASEAANETGRGMHFIKYRYIYIICITYIHVYGPTKESLPPRFQT